MVNWDDIKKELNKLIPERALEYLKYLSEKIKDKEILEKIRKEIEDIKELIKQKKDWKKTGDITISSDVLNRLEEMSKEKPALRQGFNLEKTIDVLKKDLDIKDEEKPVEYNKMSDYGKYLSDKIDSGYNRPNSTFDATQLTQNPERRHLDLINQQRKGYKEENKKEEFKYDTSVTEYKRKKE